MKNIIKSTLLFLFFFFNLNQLFLHADKVYMLGHSLVNFDLPAMFDGLANDANFNHAYAVQVGIGANLNYNWNNASSAQGDPYNIELSTGTYDAFIMTEAIPLLNHTTWSETDVYLANFYNYAKTHNSNTTVYLFETWHCTDSGTPTGCDWDDNSFDTPWRDRLNSDLVIWEGLVNDFNTANNGNMLIVPGGQALALLYDDINAGTMPDLTSINDIFSDNIHLNDIGNYYLACVYFACIYGQSPEGLTNQTYDQWGAAFTVPSLALATRLQQLAWQTVINYPLSGVSPATATSNIHLEETGISISPNPVDHNFTITGLLGSYQIEIIDTAGVVYETLTGNDMLTINMEALPLGLYYIRITQNGNPVCSIEKILKT